MRVFLPVHNYFNDPNTGAMHVLRTLLKWLAEEGATCRVLSTTRLDTAAALDPVRHLETLGVRASRRAPKKLRHVRDPRPVLSYEWAGAQVDLVLTRHNDAEKPDPAEIAQLAALVEEELDRRRPDVLLGYGSHAFVPWALRAARARGVATLVRVCTEGFENPAYFACADAVLTCSPFLSAYYRARIGLASTPIAPALDWSEIVAPEEGRAFVTFVNPSLHKGAALFGRLADMLGARRPDIPILVVQSGQSAEMLNSAAGLDFAKYPQILAAPPVPRPADFLALTRILLVPTVSAEPFGRVAAEAMINGIPPLVSDRGALPDVVGGDAAAGGGGRVLPIPGWLDRHARRLVSEDEARPWFDAVCALWDDPEAYARLARRGREIAAERYGEPVLRKAYLDAVAGVRTGGCVIA
jgi:glycosyltransferase involved in cell wall biosynthesis